jgi:hypothetical protein
VAGQQQQQSAAVVWGQSRKPGKVARKRFANLYGSTPDGPSVFTALELVLELEEGVAAVAAAVWGSSAQFQWLGQCGRLYLVLVSCSWAPHTDFSILPAATPGAGALLAMVVGSLEQLITACLVAQQAHVL